MKRLSYFLLSFCILFISAGYSMDSQQKFWLIIMPTTTGSYQNVIKINPKGEISTTGQSLYIGTDHYYINRLNYPAEQRFIWFYQADTIWRGLTQYEIKSDGLFHPTGRTLVGDYAGAVISTPDQSLLIVRGDTTMYVFRERSDGSLETTVNEYDCLYGNGYVSPRGDIFYSSGTSLPWLFRIAKIDYQKPSLTLLKEYDITYPYQVQNNAVFTPDGKYIGLIVNSNVYIYPIQDDGYLATDSVCKYNIKVDESLVITPDGRHIYGGYFSSAHGIERLDWSDEFSRFVYWGCYTTDGIQNMVVSPDGKILIVAFWGGSPTRWYIKTYFIQSDGSLEETGNVFEYSQIMYDFISANPKMVIFNVPEPTSIPSELWGNWGGE